MKVLCLFALVVVFYSTALLPQIPNGGFEQWENNNPVSWWSNNQFVPSLITLSTDAHSGSSALKGEVKLFDNNAVTPILITGEFGVNKIPISQRYAVLRGYYKLIPQDGDNLLVVVGLWKNNNVIGVGGLTFGAASNYTEFNVPIFYSNSDVPDSGQISISIGSASEIYHPGAYFILDDLSFEGVAPTSVSQEGVPSYYNLLQNYPNPFNPSTIISYSIPSAGVVTLKLFDALGNEVKTIVNEFIEAGSHNIEFNAQDLSAGVYFYRIQVNGYTASKKLILLK